MMNRNGEYSGCVDCVTKLIRSEGFFALWKGFTPYFFRLGPHTILTFVFLEQLNKLFAKYYMKQNSFVSFKHFTHISIHLFVSLSELLVVSTIIFIQTILLDDTVSDVLSLSNAFLLPSLPLSLVVASLLLLLHYSPNHLLLPHSTSIHYSSFSSSHPSNLSPYPIPDPSY